LQQSRGGRKSGEGYPEAVEWLLSRFKVLTLKRIKRVRRIGHSNGTRL